MNLNTLAEYKNDYVVVIEEYGEIVNLSTPCTYKEDALKIYNRIIDLDNFKMSWKISLKQINNNLIKQLKKQGAI